MDVVLSLDQRLVTEIDRLVGRRNRRRFIESAVRSAVARDRRRAQTAASTVEDLWAPDIAARRHASTTA